jgi:acyl-coenzyme A thioesterase PaaI-like protein
MKLRLEDDRMCYVCGKKNRAGFQLDFTHPRQGQLLSEVVFRKEHQGYKGIVHGGLVATLLDEMMVNLAWLEGLPAVTAELTVRLKKAVPVGHKVLLEGVRERGEGRLLRMRAWARSPQGELYAEAQAKCLRLPPEKAINLAGKVKQG